MDKYHVTDIFRPNTMPLHTYINREEKQGITYEKKLKRALQKTGSLIVITGGSKTGKTVLYKKVVPEKNLLELSGAQIRSLDDFWQQIAEKLCLPDELSQTYSKQETKGKKGSANLGAKFLASFLPSIQGEVRKDVSQEENIIAKMMRGNANMLKILIKGEFVLVIDDFHYIDKETQLGLSRILKAELFNGLKVILLTLPHRSDDAIMRNPDLISRTVSIDLLPWSQEEISQIATTGFPMLDINLSKEQINLISQESASSPQLMQENCYNLAMRIKEENEEISLTTVYNAFGDTVEEYQHYRESVQRICEGPAKGRKSRKLYTLKDGKKCENYGLLMLSLSCDPPVMELAASEIRRRMAQLLQKDEMPPNILNMANTIKHSENIIKSFMPALDTLEWKNNVLYILDPFLQFYLRWDKTWQKNALRQQIMP